MRGSSQARSKSEINVPTMVRVLSRSTNAPARYMSWTCSARKKSGPAVCRLSTTEIITAPSASVMAVLRDESGATLLVVVLAMVAIFGMVVLSVDLGGLVVKHRYLVSANDAAALAAAETFARGLAHVGTDEGPAQQQADSFAAQNVGDAAHDDSQQWWEAKGGIDGESCPPDSCGTVTVRFQGGQHH